MADFYVAQQIEIMRSTLYAKIERFNANTPCFGRLSGVAIIPINALALVANVLAVVIDTILEIWYCFNTSCRLGFCNLTLMPIIAAIQIPFALMEGVCGLIYDIVVPMFVPVIWAQRRREYHHEIAVNPFNAAILHFWAASLCDTDPLYNL